MNLYLIRRKEKAIRVDETAGFVVAAGTPGIARAIASWNRGDESAECWTNSNLSKVKLLAKDVKGKKAKIILANSRAVKGERLMRMEIVSSDRVFSLGLTAWMGMDPVPRDRVKIEIGGGDEKNTRVVISSDDKEFNLRLIDCLNTANVKKDSTVIRLLQENDK